MVRKNVDDEDIQRLRKAIGLDFETVEEAEPVEEEAEQLEPEEEIFEEELQEELSTPSPDFDKQLFVKLETHTEIAAGLINVKKDIQEAIGTISLLAKAEKLKGDAIEKLEESLNKIDAKLLEIDDQLVTPQGVMQPIPKEMSPLEGELSGLHSELESLKDELSKLD